MATTARTFKIHLADEIRRLNLPAGLGPHAYPGFLAKVTELFGGDELIFKWKDSDGDLITIANADDFDEVLLSQPTGAVRLYANNAGAARTPSAVSSVPSTPSTPAAPTPTPVESTSEPEWIEVEAQQQQQPEQQPEQPQQAEPEPEPEQLEPEQSTPAVEKEEELVPVPVPTPAPAEPAKPEPVLHHHVVCDGSGQQPLAGTRYHKVGRNYDLNEAEFAKMPESEKQFFEIVLYPGATPIRYEPVVHYGIVCDGTNVSPIIGTRFHKIGEDYDLSQPEFAKLEEEEKQLYELIVHPRAAPIPYKRPEDDENDEDVPEFIRLLQNAMTQLQNAMTQLPGGVIDIDVTELVKSFQQKKTNRCRRCRCRFAPQEIPAGEVLPSGTFGIGSFGPGVEQLQRFLIEYDLMDQAAIAWRAGLFGPWTRKSVAMFQKANELTADELGRFEDGTRAALIKLAEANPTTAPAAPEPVPDAAAAGPPAEEAPDPTPTPTAPDVQPARWADELAILNAMGFDDDVYLARLLDRKQGSVQAVVSAILGSR